MTNRPIDGELERRALAMALERLLAAGDAQPRGRGKPWDITMAAGLDAPKQPFEEAVWGMATREVVEPQVFRHYFGR